MSRFTVTLPSNSSMNYHPNNTASNFTTKLAEPIELHGNWECGLLEAIYPNRVFNVADDSYFFTLHHADDSQTKHYMAVGVYTNRIDITNRLRESQTAVASTLPERKVPIQFRTYAQNRWAFKIMTDEIKHLDFSPSLAHMLGFSEYQLYSGRGEHKASVSADLMGETKNIYVYCDLLEHTLVGDTKAPLLKIVKRASSADSEIGHASFNPVQYIPIQKRSFDTITVHLMTDTGTFMPFLSGKTTLVLEFRRCAHPYLLI